MYILHSMLWACLRTISDQHCLCAAVLRNAQRALDQGDGLLPPMPSPADPLPVKSEAYGVAYSHPTWMVERWLRRFGEQDTLALLEANNRYRASWDRHTVSCHTRNARPSTPLPSVCLAGEAVQTLQDVYNSDVMRERELQAQARKRAAISGCCQTPLNHLLIIHEDEVLSIQNYFGSNRV